MKLFASMAAILALAAGAVRADVPQQGSQELTLQQAVETALAANPLPRASQSGIDLARARLKEAQGEWVPRIDVGETATRSNNPTFVFSSLLEQQAFEKKDFALSRLNEPPPRTNYRTYANLRTPLFSQMRTVANVEQTRLGVKQAQAQLQGASQQVIFEVVNAYFGYTVTEQARIAAEESLKMAEADLARMKDRYATGAVTEADLLSMQVQAADFRQRLIRAKGDVAVAAAALNTAMGLPIDTPVRLASGPIDKEFAVSTQDDMVETALLNRPDYRRAQMDIQVNQQRERAARGQYLPQLDVFATVGNSTMDTSSSGTDYTFGGTLNFTLLDGGRHARLQQARAATSMAHAEQERLGNQVRMDVVRAYQQFQSAMARVKVAADSAAQANEALRMMRDRYDSGMITVTELLRAQSAQYQTRTGLLAAQYDQIVGYAGLMLATGTLDDVRNLQ